ncbi:MAG TPA: DUF58 domain-containing protein [Kouleothrix sp.]|uniref:DUF58 domain-containing protein n=1 Tax=Kouleothrix sp. TaxID=2779161 RepID=UPI002CC559D8|nr:DUF58 domain-containing protein [Kouleothrix sp.]HRC77810.1 DUF58 domain-containing protein [Kouleothrix sp.]
MRHVWARPLGVLALAGLSFLAAQGTGIRLFFHLFYLLLALLALSYVWAWLNLRGLQVQRETFTQRSQVGDQARERITIRNLWPFPKLWLELQDYSTMPQHGNGFVTYLPANDRRRWVSRTPCTIRGKFTLGPATLISGDPFGIFRLERKVEGTSEVLVYPKTAALPGFALPSAELPGGQDVKSRTYHVTPNVASIREYQPGDSFNRIHWRSTARSGQLMVKEFELDPTAEVYLVLDMQERIQQQLASALADQSARGGRELRVAESTEEYGVLAAASIARHMLELNRTVGLVSWGQHREVIPAERESRQLFKMLEALSVLRAHGAQPLAEVLAAEATRFGRNCTLVIITCSLDERWAASLQQLVYRGVRAVVVLIDPQSFGGWRNTYTIQARLAELRVPTFVFKQGQSLADALARPVTLGAELRA